MPKDKSNADYYPSVVMRLQTVNSQIEEFQRIYYRNDLELQIETALEGNVKAMKKEVDHNNEILRTKIDCLLGVRAELEKELQAEGE